jgi:hypothetical protein
LNNENLIPTNKRSKKEVRENASKGGKKSGEVRKQKAELKKLFMQFANMRPTEKESKQLIAMGFDDESLTNMTAYVVSLFKNGAKGNPKAMEIGVDLMMENNKKELENERLKQEIERLKLEQEKLKRDLGNGSDSFEDLTVLADLLKLDEEQNAEDTME